MDIEAKTAIQIAEKYFPSDLDRQKALALDIVTAINTYAGVIAGEVLEEALSKSRQHCLPWAQS